MRATPIFLKACEECDVLELPLGIPTSVIEISATTVTKLQEGPRSPKLLKTSQTFWEIISAWGGTWMWEGINADTHSKDNLTWIAEGMTNGTLIWTTGGSYDRKKAANLSGVGWKIFCSQTGMRILGNIWERLLTASSFRAEMLGLCALHLLAHAISKYYKLDRWTPTLCCDNKLALLLSSHHRGCKGQAPNVSTSDEASAQLSKHTMKDSRTYTCRDTWINTYPGCS
jgi:hypothetical protein